MDKGFKRILQAIKAMQKEAQVAVGIVQNQVHENSNLTIAQIAAVHEYGCAERNIPARSFMRSTFDEKKNENMEFTKKLYDKVLMGTISEKEALG